MSTYTLTNWMSNQTGVSVWHPTDRPNFTIIRTDRGTFYVSYQTVVAFNTGDGLVICENVWSQTTGRHLNWIDRDHSRRLPYEEFVARFTEAVTP